MEDQLEDRARSSVTSFMDRQYTLSIRGRWLLFIGLAVAIFGIAGSFLKIEHDRRLSAQKMEFKRRLYFLDSATKALGTASSIMRSYDAGDTAFGLARQEALEAHGRLAKLAKTTLEGRLAIEVGGIVDVYSDCRGQLAYCDSRINNAESRCSAVFDELMVEAKKYDWRPPEEQAEDDPLEGYSPPTRK